MMWFLIVQRLIFTDVQTFTPSCRAQLETCPCSHKLKLKWLKLSNSHPHGCIGITGEIVDPLLMMKMHILQDLPNPDVTVEIRYEELFLQEYQIIYQQSLLYFLGGTVDDLKFALQDSRCMSSCMS